MNRPGGTLALSCSATSRDQGESGRARAREALGTIRAVSRQVLGDLLAIVATLRGSLGANGPPPGVDQLDALTSQAAGAGLGVERRVQGVARRLPPAVDLTTYRIVQEALTNVLRHAGPATATVRLIYGDDQLRVQVEDDGHRGVAGWPPGGGNGLLGLRERVAALGGRLEAGPRPVGGFRVLATLPLDGAA